ncbi:MAG: hypothetical protein ABII85_03830 [Bacillota bacterium]
MQSFILNWAFLLIYDKNDIAMNIKFSNQFIEDYQLSYRELMLVEKEIASYLHRYDYKKLEYFSNIETPLVFDTLMRFKFKKCKHSLRTIAICSVQENGLSCINFLESKVMNVRRLIRKNLSINSIKLINIENESELKDIDQTFLTDLYAHLEHIMERVLKIS